MRARKGLTYAQLASHTAYSTTVLQRADSGTTVPSLHLALAHARACGLSPGEVRRLWQEARREDCRIQAPHPDRSGSTAGVCPRARGAECCPGGPVGKEWCPACADDGGPRRSRWDLALQRPSHRRSADDSALPPAVAGVPRVVRSAGKRSGRPGPAPGTGPGSTVNENARGSVGPPWPSARPRSLPTVASRPGRPS
ncbi:XRE family transcriptional regulator [Streptomyces sp. TM32]|nr:XRE family transcriptional regulator [Streptomyces sp. TM32]